MGYGDAIRGSQKRIFHISLADDASYTLPSLVNNGHGFITVGSDVERTEFTVDSAGTVNIIMGSDNVVANANTDTAFCIGTAATQNPLILKNRLGATRVVNIEWNPY